MPRAYTGSELEIKDVDLNITNSNTSTTGDEKSTINTVLKWIGIGVGVLIVLYIILRIIKR